VALSAEAAANRLLLRSKTEGEGFEPSDDLTAVNGFRARYVQPVNPVVEPDSNAGGNVRGNETWSLPCKHVASSADPPWLELAWLTSEVHDR